MRTSTIALTAVALAALTSAASAQDSAPDAAKSPFTVSGGATITSDYRFRGVSQTDKRFAVQGTVNITHETGLYVGTFASSIDDYVATGGDAEIDLYGGYKYSFSGTTADVGILSYSYPGSGGGTSDFVEPYAALTHSFGPIGTKLGVAYAPRQHGQRCDYDPRCTRSREDNLYLYGEASFTVPDTGFALTGHAGHSNGRSYLTNGLKDYWDWNVGASYAWHGITFGVSYVDTDIKKSEFDVGPAYGRRYPATAGVLASIGAAF